MVAVLISNGELLILCEGYHVFAKCHVVEVDVIQGDLGGVFILRYDTTKSVEQTVSEI